MDKKDALRFIVNAQGYIYQGHALVRMMQRGVSRIDVICVLKTAQIQSIHEGDHGRWCVVGKDSKDEKLTVVVAIEVLLVGTSRNVIITVY